MLHPASTRRVVQAGNQLHDSIGIFAVAGTAPWTSPSSAPPHTMMTTLKLLA